MQDRLLDLVLVVLLVAQSAVLESILLLARRLVPTAQQAHGVKQPD
jgi:hypothetical protein